VKLSVATLAAAAVCCAVHLGLIAAAVGLFVGGFGAVSSSVLAAVAVTVAVLVGRVLTRRGGHGADRC